MNEPWNKIYPWNAWFDCVNRKTLWRGEDFVCLPHSMAQQVRNEALRRGVKVSVEISEDSIRITQKGKA